MRTSVWYRTEEKQPDNSGYYLSYRGWGMGGKADGDSDHGYVYYDKKKNSWRDYISEHMGHSAIVYYWTNATPDEWVDADPPSVKIRNNTAYKGTLHTDDHPAVQDAWADVEEAIKRYETVKALCEKS